MKMHHDHIHTIFDGERKGVPILSVLALLNDDFEGGELYYPDLNLSYTPSAGDLVIHGSRITHGVAEVKSGIRYVYPSFLY
jgi:predicted 2-oxoglutarate/Fe(II)-dependent dioxygenase YbiX